LAEVKNRETLISSPVRGNAAMQEANFVADSLLEGRGFEPLVPLVGSGPVSRQLAVRKV